MSVLEAGRLLAGRCFRPARGRAVAAVAKAAGPCRCWPVEAGGLPGG